jgi:exopolysaccharide biosynthesis operon protein EpsL
MARRSGCAAHATVIPGSRLCEGSWAQAPAHGVAFRGHKLKKMPIRPLVCLISACVFPAVLRAEPPDLIDFRVGAGVEHNTNVLRTTTGEQSDDITVLSVGAKIDRTYSLQRFRADLEASKYYYRNLSNLDYSTLNYLLAWDWRFTPALHGVLSSERREFRDIGDTVAGIQEIGIRKERTELFEGIYDIDGVWRALAGVSQTSSSTTLPESWDGSPTVRSARVGGGYEFASGSSIFVRARRGDGEYKAAQTPGAPADFQETEGDAQLKWILTGKTSLDARLGYLDRTHDGAPQRDFDGPQGSATVVWDATGKTRVVAGLQHYLSSSGLDTGGFVESDRFFLGPVWRATAHTSVNARYEWVGRDWRDIAAGEIEAGRRDVIQILSLGVDWAPRRLVTVTGSLRGERVKSNQPGSSYRNNAVAVGMRLNF